MSNFIQFSLVILLFVSLISCGNSETESTDTVENKSEESSAEIRVPQVDEPGTFQEMLTIILDNLSKRLSLSTEQRKEIKIIYQNAHLEDGGSLDDKIDRGRAKYIRKNILTNSSTEVLNLLSEDQQKFYNRIMESQ